MTEYAFGKTWVKSPENGSGITTYYEREMSDRWKQTNEDGKRTGLIFCDRVILTFISNGATFIDKPKFQEYPRFFLMEGRNLVVVYNKESKGSLSLSLNTFKVESYSGISISDMTNTLGYKEIFNVNKKLADFLENY